MSVRFKHVAGCDEAKAEINKILDQDASSTATGTGTGSGKPKENRDWRSAMAAMDDYLAQNK